MAIETLLVEQESTPLDLLLWRRFLRPIEGLVERTLDINPGLAGAGIILPVGTRVIVEIPPTASVPTLDVVSLWD